MGECPDCKSRTMRPVSGSISRCIQCGFQIDAKARKKIETPVSAPYVQPGGVSTPGTNFPVLTTACPFCTLQARRIGSAKYEFRCDNNHVFCLDKTGTQDAALLDVNDIGPIMMGSE